MECTVCCPKGKKRKNSSKSVFDTVGKTFYVLQNKTLLCFRHWHQADRPNYIFSGEYYKVVKFLKP